MKEKLIRFFGSLHIHFFLIIFLAAMIPASLITTGFVRLYENRQIQTDYSQITSQAKLITNQILVP